VTLFTVAISENSAAFAKLEAKNIRAIESFFIIYPFYKYFLDENLRS